MLLRIVSDAHRPIREFLFARRLVDGFSIGIHTKYGRAIDPDVDAFGSAWDQTHAGEQTLAVRRTRDRVEGALDDGACAIGSRVSFEERNFEIETGGCVSECRQREHDRD